MSVGSIPAAVRACWAAWVARPEVDPPMRRSAMPVRSRIHSSVVSIQAIRSALERTLSGNAAPTPVILRPQGAAVVIPPPR